MSALAGLVTDAKRPAPQMGAIIPHAVGEVSIVANRGGAIKKIRTSNRAAISSGSLVAIGNPPRPIVRKSCRGEIDPPFDVLASKFLDRKLRTENTMAAPLWIK